MNNCKLREGTVFSFRNIQANCTLSFGQNTKFKYEVLENSKVSLEREHISINISKTDFEKLFMVLD